MAFTPDRLLQSILITALIVASPLAIPSGSPSTPGSSAHVFDPSPITEPMYSIQWPHDNENQRFFLPGPRASLVFVEVALPGPGAPPDIPTILMMTPYGIASNPGANDLENENLRHRHTIEYFVPRGYAVAVGHVPGTGRSSGCWDLNGADEVEATTRVIEFLSDPEQAPWSNGRVGMYGLSYDAVTQIAAASRADPGRIDGLKAIVPVAGFAGEYDALARDGVQAYPILASYGGLVYNGYYGSLPPNDPTWRPEGGLSGRSFDCSADGQRARLELDASGAYSSYWGERDARVGVANVRAATLVTAGAADYGVPVNSLVGWFNRLPDDVPRSAIISQYRHGFPDASDGPRPDWTRTVHAWFDEYLMELDAGTTSWPMVQLEDSGGRWRATPSWPEQGGPPAQLALSPDGALGQTRPGSGTTSLQSPSWEGITGSVKFRTPRLDSPLHVTGLPVLDLHITVTDPDTRVAAVLRAYDAEDKPLSQPLIHGARHVRYAQPMPDDYFHPETQQAVAQGIPFRLPIRLSPADLVVPAGGTLEISISGSVAEGCTDWCTIPSTHPSEILIHHGCEAPSILRFELPASSAKLISFPHEPHHKGPFTIGLADGDGLATQRVCGDKPLPPLDVTRASG